MNDELEKEKRWLRHRQRTRALTRLNYLRADKPISAGFRPFSEVEDRVRAFRARRKPTFLRLYPWAKGDPRVFWWRMIEAFAPKCGAVLNVGALPPDQKDEDRAFLPPDTLLRDVDIDAGRAPDFNFDVVDMPERVGDRFDGVFLFGLPYFASPSAAVSACARLTRPGGVGLFGFAADTNPMRGSVWHPHHRRLWRRDREPLEDIGLKGNLWAFDEAGLAGLFRPWADVRFEFVSHYWFAVARRHD